MGARTIQFETAYERVDGDGYGGKALIIFKVSIDDDAKSPKLHKENITRKSLTNIEAPYMGLMVRHIALAI